MSAKSVRVTQGDRRSGNFPTMPFSKENTEALSPSVTRCHKPLLDSDLQQQAKPRHTAEVPSK